MDVPWICRRPEMLAQIDASQYTFSGGESACTAISCTAAVHLLSMLSWDVASCQDFSELAEVGLKSIIEEGVALSRRISEHATINGNASHENVFDLLEAPPARRLRERIHVELPQHTETRRGEEAFLAMITKALRGTSTPQALIVTKPPETVLLVWAPILSRPFLLFDSHSVRGCGASLLWFPNEISLAAELAERFPFVSIPDADENSQMVYNMCECTAVRLIETASDKTQKENYTEQSPPLPTPPLVPRAMIGASGFPPEPPPTMHVLLPKSSQDSDPEQVFLSRGDRTADISVLLQMAEDVVAEDIENPFLQEQEQQQQMRSRALHEQQQEKEQQRQQQLQQQQKQQQLKHQKFSPQPRQQLQHQEHLVPSETEHKMAKDEEQELVQQLETQQRQRQEQEQEQQHQQQEQQHQQQQQQQKFQSKEKKQQQQHRY